MTTATANVLLDRTGWTQERGLADPAGFVRDVLKVALWSKQREILDLIFRKRRVAVRSCNGSGKTYCAAALVLAFLLLHEEAIVVTTAPTMHQVRDLLWREIKMMVRRRADLFPAKSREAPDGVELLVSRIEVDPRRFAVGLTTDEPERFQGYHAKNILFVVDEASGVEQDVYDAIEGSMTSEGARMLLIGNPTRTSGQFYDAFNAGGDGWGVVHISAFDTPNMKAGEVVLPGLVTPVWVQEKLLHWGEKSSRYRVRVLGEFPEGEGDVLIARSVVEGAVSDGLRANGRIEAGVDVARYGDDDTVIAVRSGGDVFRLASFSHESTMSTVGRVVRLLDELKPSVVRVDEIGVGAGVVDRLRELGHREVQGVNVASSPVNVEHFLNARAEYYDGLRGLFEAGKVRIPRDAELVTQLATLRFEFTSTGHVKLQSKEDLRRRGLESPDKADAVMLAFAAVPRMGMGSFGLWT